MRHTILWNPGAQEWTVLRDDEDAVADFPTLLEAEQFVIAESERREVEA